MVDTTSNKQKTYIKRIETPQRKHYNVHQVENDMKWWMLIRHWNHKLNKVDTIVKLIYFGTRQRIFSDRYLERRTYRVERI